MVASAAPDERTLVMVRTFEATPERLFAAWTDPAAFMEWFGPHGMTNTHCRFELRVGGVWEVTAEGLGTTRAISGKYLAIDPPRLLSFTETTVTIQFRPVGKRTELMLTQARFRDAGGTTRHNWGWSQSFEKLDAFISGRP
jgi:uncharacterized protein YndB with AHSA1/START domain